MATRTASYFLAALVVFLAAIVIVQRGSLKSLRNELDIVQSVEQVTVAESSQANQQSTPETDSVGPESQSTNCSGQRRTILATNVIEILSTNIVEASPEMLEKGSEKEKGSVPENRKRVNQTVLSQASSSVTINNLRSWSSPKTTCPWLPRFITW